MVFCEMLLMEGVKDIGANAFDRIKHAVEMAVENENIETDTELCVAVSDDAQIRELNRDFRNIDSATDVLSFPANDAGGILADAIQNGFEAETGESGAIFLGDIVISADTAARQAEEYGNEFAEEMCFLAVHGVLHLLGYDHIEPDDEQLMREKQRVLRAMRNGGKNGI